MKRILYVWMAAILLAPVAASFASAQAAGEPLGDYARSARKDKKPSSAKRYDNDNLPVSEKLSVVGNAPAPTAENTSAPAQPGDANTAKPGAETSGKKPEATAQDESADAKKKLLDQWKDKLDKQKDQVDLAARELDVTQREYRLRAAAFYSDAGNRLRSPGGWDQEDGQFKQKIEEKQKALDAAKLKLTDMQEDARKSGVPSSARE